MSDCMATVIRDYDDHQLLQYLNNTQSEGSSREKVMQICVIDDEFFQYYNCSTLMLALRLSKSIDVLLKLIEIGERELIVTKNKNDGRTALHYVCRNRTNSIHFITRLIEIGGWELIAMRDLRGETALHHACKSRNLSIEVISKLIEIGRRKLVVMTNKRGETSLHYLCRTKNITIDMISKLLEAGGLEILLLANQSGKTVLHYACTNENVSIDIISKLVELGGSNLVTMKDNYDRTALHDACRNRNISVSIISKLIEVGGSKLLMAKDQDGRTALHDACRNGNASIDVLSKLIKEGGQKLLMMNDKNGNISLHHAFFSDRVVRLNNNDAFILLIQESIAANVGGEFGMGGVFNIGNQQVQNTIYQNWNEFSPALKSAFEAMSTTYPLILHAAILAKVPLHVIQNITNEFKHSILKIDSLGRYPFEVALEEGLCWIQGLQEVIKATATTRLQHPKIIHSASQYGLKWRQYMKELADEVSYFR